MFLFLFHLLVIFIISFRTLQKKLSILFLYRQPLFASNLLYNLFAIRPTPANPLQPLLGIYYYYYT